MIFPREVQNLTVTCIAALVILGLVMIIGPVKSYEMHPPNGAPLSLTVSLKSLKKFNLITKLFFFFLLCWWYRW